MPTQTHILESRKDDLSARRFTDQTLPDPEPGAVIARVERFALTANNITYGLAGDTLGYWRFFPADEPWGRIPVWGFAVIAQSAHPDVSTGTRVFGYFPMATHLLLAPVNATSHGFADGAAHRQDLPPVYNAYTFTAADPAYRADAEDEQMLYRPLFSTSFLLDDFLADNALFGAEQVVLTSASSKTTIGLAHLLSRRTEPRCRVVGLTATANRAFVEGLGCYDTVLGYDDVGSLPRSPAVLVDVAGSARVRAAVHETLGDALKYSSSVGATHWQDAVIGPGDGPLPGPTPTLFFAPTQAQKRIGELGRAGFEARLAEAWQGFLDAANGWIEIHHCDGEQALARVYDDFIAGRADPAVGYVASLHPASSPG